MFDVKFTTENEGILKRLRERIPRATEYALEQVLRTLKVKIQRATPVGIRRVSIKRKKSGEPVKGRAGRVRWRRSGELQRSWEVSREGMKIVAGTITPYSFVPELGKFRGVGKPKRGMMSGGEGQISPRTIAQGKKIWSSRAVGGILKPLIDDNAFADGIVSTIIREMNKNLKAA